MILAAACRSIYLRAAESHILPPLIHDVASPWTPQREIKISGRNFSIVLRAFYEASPCGPAPRTPCPGGLKGAEQSQTGKDGKQDTRRAAKKDAQQAPLRFEITAADGPEGRPVELDEAARYELIRAFFLGVREPLSVDTPPDCDGCRLSLRIAAGYRVRIGEFEHLDAGLSKEEICDHLADRLLALTQSFFASQAAGREVWKTRLREEMFGEPPQYECYLWPPAEAPARLAALRENLMQAGVL
ncbi:MAG: hypothetical protein ACK5JM_01950 [Rhodoblastus sp.]